MLGLRLPPRGQRAREATRPNRAHLLEDEVKQGGHDREEHQADRGQLRRQAVAVFRGRPRRLGRRHRSGLMADRGKLGYFTRRVHLKYPEIITFR